MHSVTEVVYKMRVLENRANDLAHSVTEVVYKMRVLENRVSEVKYKVTDLAHSVTEVVYKMSVLENRVTEELHSIQLLFWQISARVESLMSHRHRRRIRAATPYPLARPAGQHQPQYYCRDRREERHLVSLLKSAHRFDTRLPQQFTRIRG